MKFYILFAKILIFSCRDHFTFLVETFEFTWYCTHTGLHPLSYNWIRGRRGLVLFLLYPPYYIIYYYYYIIIIILLLLYYYIHQGNRLDKERKIVRKKLSFMHTRFNTFFWYNSVQVQFHVYPFHERKIYKYTKYSFMQFFLYKVSQSIWIRVGTINYNSLSIL